MKEKDETYPAAIPLISFAAGLELYGRAVDPSLLLAGSALIALLLAMLPPARRRRLFTAALFFVAGLFIGRGALLRDSADDVRFAATPKERFVTVVAVMNRDWEELGGSRRLRVDSFTVIDRNRQLRFDRRLTFWMDEPPDTGLKREISVEGFLRRGRGSHYHLTVKSPELLHYGGTVSPWEPSFWNRLVSQRLERFAGRNETLDRAIILTRALALGRSDRLPEDVKRSYRNAGTYHLLVFSGMQIAFAAAFLVLALRLFHSPRVADWSLLALSLLAPLFAGSEPSVGRSAWMIGCYAVSRLLHRPTSVGNLLFFSALVRLAAVPGDLHDGGFALTYAAAGGVILLGGALACHLPARRRTLRLLARGFGAELATTPLSIAFFNRYVIGSSVLTLLIAPVIALMLFLSVLFCASAALFPSALTPLAHALIMLDACCRITNDLAAETLGVAGLVAAPPSFFLLLATVAFLAIFLVSRPTRRWIASFALLIVPAAALCQALATRDFRGASIEALDVGQGDAILLRAARFSMLVDGGGSARTDGFGERVVIPRLLGRGVRSLDVVMLSHAHPDHCSGLSGVLRSIPVRSLWLSGRQWREPCVAELAALAADLRIPVVVAEHAGPVRYGNVTITPYTPRLRFKRSAANNGSLVVHVAAAGLTALLPGDVEKDAERLLVEEFPAVEAIVLKVPHHGSRTSTTDALLDIAQPRFALLSCGLENPYGHPAGETVDRLAERGVRLLRTDLQGDVGVALVDGHFLRLQQFDCPRSAE